MKTFRKNTFFLLILSIICLLMVSCGENARTSSPPIDDTKTIIGEEVLHGLNPADSNTIVFCLSVDSQGILTTTDPAYDGDMPETYEKTKYLLTENTEFFSEETHRIVHSSAQKSTTTVTYTKLTYGEFLTGVNNGSLQAPAYLWLDEHRHCMAVMVYGSTEIQE